MFAPRCAGTIEECSKSAMMATPLMEMGALTHAISNLAILAKEEASLPETSALRLVETDK